MSDKTSRQFRALTDTSSRWENVIGWVLAIAIIAAIGLGIWAYGNHDHTARYQGPPSQAPTVDRSYQCPAC